MTWQGLVAFYGARDLDATHLFYNEILELPLFKDQGLCRIYLVPGGGHLGFCSHMSAGQGERGPIITLLTQDVDKVYQRLVEAGITPPHQPQKNPRFKIYHFFIQDPNGYLVEVQRFLD
jgi:catechol 2,3-dioxygenase-like lactoylglutathione lyase family enzyme